MTVPIYILKSFNLLGQIYLIESMLLESPYGSVHLMKGEKNNKNIIVQCVPKVVSLLDKKY